MVFSKNTIKILHNSDLQAQVIINHMHNETVSKGNVKQQKCMICVNTSSQLTFSYTNVKKLSLPPPHHNYF